MRSMRRLAEQALSRTSGAALSERNRQDPRPFICIAMPAARRLVTLPQAVLFIISRVFDDAPLETSTCSSN